MKIQKTETYPVRYAAFDVPGVLWLNANPKIEGGQEWAIFNDYDDKGIYAELISYQDKYLLLDITSPQGHRHTCRFAGYHNQFDKAIDELISVVNKLLAKNDRSVVFEA